MCIIPARVGGERGDYDGAVEVGGERGEQRRGGEGTRG